MSDILADVSRETLDRLSQYEAALRRWNPKINLVSHDSLRDVWQRHFLDSAQIFAHRQTDRGLWLDLGSGGGFPGLVLAIIAREKCPELNFCLVESDHRKAAFLRSVARECGLTMEIKALRIEDLRPQNALTITARALASLENLLALAMRHGTSETTYIFPKGRTVGAEIIEAQGSFRFEFDQIPSTTDPEASLIIVRNLHRV